MTAVWAAHHEELCSDGIVAPLVFDPLVGPDLEVVLEWCTPPGAAVDTGLDAATHARRAQCPADGGVVYVLQALHVSPSVPLIHAQRVPRFDHYCTRNCLSPKESRRDIQ